MKYYKNLEVGGVYETNNFGDLEIVTIESSTKALVRFVKTGYETVAELGSIRTGQVKDWSNSFKSKVGKQIETTSYGIATVLEYIDDTKVLIRFENTGYEGWFRATNLSLGRAYDPLAKITGEGFLGVGDYSRKKNPKAYHHWHQMLTRCGIEEEKFKNYFDKEITNDWLCFQNFASWAESQVGFSCEKWQLDKDILVKGNKVYSPETCCFVPHRINSLIIKSNPQGSWSDKHKRWYFSYREEDSTKVRKGFESQEEGYTWYARNKQTIVKRVAEIYKKDLDSRVYDALQSWTVG